MGKLVTLHPRLYVYIFSMNRVYKVGSQSGVQGPLGDLEGPPGTPGGP